MVGGTFGGNLKDIEHEIDPLPLAGSFTPDGTLASVCVLEIQAPIDAPTWGQIKYLATDGDHQGGGHGMSAIRAALLYILAHTDEKEFGLWADNYSETYKSARLEPNRSHQGPTQAMIRDPRCSDSVREHKLSTGAAHRSLKFTSAPDDVNRLKEPPVISHTKER